MSAEAQVSDTATSETGTADTEISETADSETSTMADTDSAEELRSEQDNLADLDSRTENHTDRSERSMSQEGKGSKDGVAGASTGGRGPGRRCPGPERFHGRIQGSVGIRLCDG